MPGAVELENGNQPGVGGTTTHKTAQDIAVANGGGHIMTLPIRSNDLPPEIYHVADGFIPLQNIITRLAQMTHNQLSDKIRQLASMPLPQAQHLNGANREEFDQSNESVTRKVALNNTMQMLHGKWVKMLVIVNWSRKAQDVSKLIDLKMHMMNLQFAYDQRLAEAMETKRQLSFAREPSPDIKTALHVLSTGDGSFMPDFGYIEPSPLTDEELEKWIDDLNTALSIRLNIDDYDKIPIHFHDYEIKNGRVIFGVAGEFEIHLTIAEQDPTSQFWFVDFKFLCLPAPREVPRALRESLEAIVNATIAKDNLTGCYNVLHEYTLTYKINELKRQAYELSKMSWNGALSVETLDRAISLQYWPKRLGSQGSKHWVIVAVDSKQKVAGWNNPKNTSTLLATWFRDGKPVKDEPIEFDHNNLSTLDLITAAIGKHIEYIFKSMYKSVITRFHRYNSGQAVLAVDIDRKNPAKSVLRMQTSLAETVTLRIEPMTGQFKFDVHSRQSLQAETMLNNTPYPARDGARLLGSIRYNFLYDEFQRKCLGTDWMCWKAFSKDDVKAHLQIRDPMFWYFCLQRQDMMPNWCLIYLIRPEGDEWYLCRVNPPSRTVATPTLMANCLPVVIDMAALRPDLCARFWDALTKFMHDKMSELSEDLSLVQVMSTSKKSAVANPLAPNSRPVSNSALSLHEIVPSASSNMQRPMMNADETSTTAQSGSLRTPWAHDSINIIFNGVFPMDPITGAKTPTWLSTCIVKVLDKSKFKDLGGSMARDISFNHHTGEFCIQIYRPVFQPVKPLLKPRLEAIHCVVNFLDAMNKAGPSVRCESVALQRVAFTYTSTASRLDLSPPEELAGHTWTVTFDLSQPTNIVMLLDENDPHQMVGGMLTRLANEPEGLHTLVRTLPRTLPLMEAIAEVVAASPRKMDQGKGAVRALHLSAGASCLIYHLSSGFPVRLDIRARIRNGNIWWVLERVAMNGHALLVQPEESDADVLQRLDVLFSQADEARRWVAMGTGLTTQGVKHIRAMIMAADQQVWGP